LLGKIVLVLLLLLPSLARAASGDTGAIPPYLATPVPDFSVPSGQSWSMNGYTYIPCTTFQGSTDPFPASFTLSPQIPGVTINPLTGIASGTPTSSMSNVVLTCTTLMGSAQDVFNLTVQASSGTVATGYFVDCAAGNDSANGTSHATPWKTLSKVNSAVTASGSDVWLKAGVACEDQTVTIDWSGTSADGAIVGAYYVAGVQAYQGCSSSGCTPTNRPEINGTYTSACSRALGAPVGSACSVGIGNSVPGSLYNNPPPANPVTPVPVNIFTGLVTVTSASYVTLQDLFITESAGIGIDIDASPHLTMDDVRVDSTATGGILAKGSQYTILRNSDISRTAAGGSTGDLQYDSKGHAVSMQNMQPAYTLVENNYIHETFGEGLNCPRQSFVIYRGNRFESTYNVSIYATCTDSVFENNEIYGATIPSPPTLPGGGWTANVAAAIQVSIENVNQGNLANLVIRNNRAANVRHCFNVNVFPGGAREAGLTTGGKMIGNTCVAYGGTGMGMPNPAVNVSAWEVADNIFDQPKAGSTTCNVNAAANISIHNNAWAALPSAACRGTNDVTGASGVSTTFNWATAGYGNYPTTADWELVGHGTAVAANAGASALVTASAPNLAASYLQWSSMTGLQAGGGACLPTQANWNLLQKLDFDCVIRTSPPDIGAQEN
jgi:hypothetical protein